MHCESKALVHVSAWCLEHFATRGKLRLDGVLFAGVGAGSAVAGLFCLTFMRLGGNAAQAWFALGIFSLVITVAVWPVLGATAMADAITASPGRDRKSVV